MAIGEICWADLPRSDGHEQSGHRPVMILQDDSYAGSLPTTLIIPLTSAASALRFPGTVQIPATQHNGLAVDSVVLVFQIRVLDRRRLRGRIGTADGSVVLQVYEALDRLTGRNRMNPPPATRSKNVPPISDVNERDMD